MALSFRRGIIFGALLLTCTTQAAFARGPRQCDACGQAASNAPAADAVTASDDLTIVGTGDQAVVVGQVEETGQVVSFLFLVIGTGQLHAEVIDCCIEGDTIEANFNVIGFGGQDGDLVTFTSPDTGEFTSQVRLLSLVRVSLQYTQAPGGLPAGFEVTCGLNPPPPSGALQRAAASASRLLGL